MRNILFLSVLSIIVAISVACGGSQTAGIDTGKVIKSGPAGNNLTATLANTDGVLRKGKQNITLKFTDASGKAVDVGAASLNFHMPAMGSMATMNNPSTLTTTSTPGVYSGSVDLEMSGEWQAQIAYQGAVGTGKVNLPVAAQ